MEGTAQICSKITLVLKLRLQECSPLGKNRLLRKIYQTNNQYQVIEVHHV
jgi:hypothetical protein